MANYLNAYYPLITNGTATGPSVYWPGGKGTFSVVATFNGATIKLQTQGPDNSTWIDAGPDSSFTANGICVFELGESQIRAFVSGGPPAGVYALAEGIV